jgi:hypothetical protein
MLPDTSNKNIYGLLVGISKVLNILEHFWFKGDRTIFYGHDLNPVKCYLTKLFFIQLGKI